MTQEFNKFEHIGNYVEGCETGTHFFPSDRPELTIGEDGLTVMKLVCQRCGKVIAISAPLDVNKYLTPSEPQTQTPVQPIITQTQNQPQLPTDIKQDSEILRKLFGK